MRIRWRTKTAIIPIAAALLLSMAACNGGNGQNESDPVTFVEVDYDGSLADGTYIDSIDDFIITLHHESGLSGMAGEADGCELENPGPINTVDVKEYRIACRGVTGYANVVADGPAKSDDSTQSVTHPHAITQNGINSYRRGSIMGAFLVGIIAFVISAAIFYFLVKYAVIAAIEHTGLGKASRKYTGDTKKTLANERRLESYGSSSE
ncbi:hypothetical protein [Bifidobacterium castoris]|uniref:Lipoprotein n=1 Tax=Bifidobacterium castoris TaxID=2306972 RepID=A0A430F7J7_9BIFI|nr:hypothetical protein [Bifidobacterium castoris]RSX48905.1 hypothetical protein D2E22_1043 [Bifidobacterium castoris]